MEKPNLLISNHCTVAEAMEHAFSNVEGLVLSEKTPCCRSFPGECYGCPDFEEAYPTLAAFSGWFGICFGPSYIIKRCKRFKWKSYEEIRR